MSDEHEQFGRRLEAALSERNVTRRQAAEAIGCTGATMGRWIRGEAPYSVLFLIGLHREYGIDLNELICGEEK